MAISPMLVKTIFQPVVCICAQKSFWFWDCRQQILSGRMPMPTGRPKKPGTVNPFLLIMPLRINPERPERPERSRRIEGSKGISKLYYAKRNTCRFRQFTHHFFKYTDLKSYSENSSPGYCFCLLSEHCMSSSF